MSEELRALLLDLAKGGGLLIVSTIITAYLTRRESRAKVLATEADANLDNAQAVKITTDQLVESLALVRTYASKVDELERADREKGAALASLEEALALRGQEIEDLQAASVAKQARVAALEAEDQKKLARIAQLEEKLARKSEEIDTLEASRVEDHKEMRTLRIQQRENMVELVELRERVSDLRTGVEILTSQIVEELHAQPKWRPSSPPIQPKGQEYE